MLKNGNRSYQEASRAIQNNLQKHIESDKFQWSDSDEEAADDDQAEQLQRLVQGYKNTTAKGSAEEKEFVKSVLDGIKNALCTSSCLICISTVKKNDAIWNCQNCYNSFHLDCIKKWAKDSIFQQKNLIEEKIIQKRKLEPVARQVSNCELRFQNISVPLCSTQTPCSTTLSSAAEPPFKRLNVSPSPP